ncbi:MAG: hypothetical protein ABR499_19360 [Gemmatimonadaceae bacterium]
MRIRLPAGRAPLVGMAVGVLLASILMTGVSRVVAGARALDPVVIGACRSSSH